MKKRINLKNKMLKIRPYYLSECLDYNSDTGDLTWKTRPESHFKTLYGFKSWNTRFANKKAGTLKNDGYIHIVIDYRSYLAHRVGYAIYHGYFPENDVDHKDRVRNHNWIMNLREVSRQCNIRNSGIASNNTSGIKGVSFCNREKKWVGRINVSKKTIGLGYFKNLDDAVFARWEAEKKYKFPNCCTSSSSYNYLKDRGLI